MEDVLALQNTASVQEFTDNELEWSTCSAQQCNSSSVFVPAVENP
jgi:hypothetical protein